MIYAETSEAAHNARARFVTTWRKRASRAVASLLEAQEDLLAFHAF